MNNTIETWSLQSICVLHNWFTCGDNAQYKKLFEMNRKGRTLRELALCIWLCSEDVTEEDIYSKLLQLKLSQS